MFKLQPDPTFESNVKVPLPGGETRTIRVEFVYLDETQYADLVSGMRDAPIDVFVGGLVSGWHTQDDADGRWHGMDVPFSKEALTQLRKAQPRALQAMVATWLHETKGLPLKN